MMAWLPKAVRLVAVRLPVSACVHRLRDEMGAPSLPALTFFAIFCGGEKTIARSAVLEGTMSVSFLHKSNLPAVRKAASAANVLGRWNRTLGQLLTRTTIEVEPIPKCT